ncbi:hypothetical protein AB205_0045860 [Aquarana catesbeiana]|uniref:Uncharacterized protein n=1 Tax=Aquarana catesbeiana TaxID=8400 RepID=A0A2G9S1A8_AQUCT|nr:hypothetical protein AB205_0045860 [Aquarana catesbeiana]
MATSQLCNYVDTLKIIFSIESLSLLNISEKNKSIRLAKCVLVCVMVRNIPLAAEKQCKSATKSALKRRKTEQRFSAEHRGIPV